VFTLNSLIILHLISFTKKNKKIKRKKINLIKQNQPPTRMDRTTQQKSYWATKTGTWGGEITWTAYGVNPSSTDPQRYWQVVTTMSYSSCR